MALVQSWDLDFRQLDRGPFRGTLLQYGVEESQVGIASSNRKFDQRGIAPASFVSFAMLGQGAPPIIWRGVEVDQNKVMIYGPGDEIDCSSEPGFNVTTYSISKRLFSKRAHEMGILEPEKLVSRRKVFALSARTRKQLLSTIAGASRIAAIYRADDNDDSIRSTLEVTIPHLFLKAVAKNQGARISNPLTKRRKKALKTIEWSLVNSGIPPTSVRELCQLTGVSERTLQYLFKWKYNITPKAYIKLVRLNGVRRELYRASSRKVKILDVANNWGFWHMGQFAADYRESFGELPSNTLKNRKRK